MSRPGRVNASTDVKEGDFRCYSNTSDDALGLSGAFADIGSTLSQAQKAILITSWKLSPGLHLPFFHEDLRIALQKHEKNDLDAAKKHYLAIIQNAKKFPLSSIENHYAHYFLSIIALSEGKIADAEKYLAICLTAEPKNPQFHNTQLYIVYFQGKLKEASEQAELLADGVTDASFFALYGDILSDLADQEELFLAAEEKYQSALRENQECIPAMRGLGKLYLKTNRIDEAITVYARVLNYYPTDPIANLQLAEIALKQNRVDDAIRYAENALHGGCDDAALLNMYALSYCKKYLVDERADAEKLDNCMSLVNQALKNDQANFLLSYYKALIAFKKNDVALTEKLLQKCMKINPNLLEVQLNQDEAIWPAKYKDALNIENKKVTFNHAFPEDLPLHQKIKAAKALIKLFPFSRDAYFKLAVLYAENKNYSHAMTHFLHAADLAPSDTGYLQTVIKRLNALLLDRDEDKAIRVSAIAEYFSLIKKTHSHCDFYDAYAHFREQLPTLGELLIQKACDNPDMVVALQLWNRSSPGDLHYADEITKEFKAIAEKLGLLEIPKNLLLRFTNTDSVGYTHHQKYIVVDTGTEHPTVFYGSCDLAFGKFDWSDHSLVNTVNNSGAVSRAHGFNRAENMRRAGESKLSLPWREVISRADGPITVDFVKAFEERWRAKGHGTFSGTVRGTVGAQDQNQVAGYAVTLQTDQLKYTGRDTSDSPSSPVLFATRSAFPHPNTEYDERTYPFEAQLLQSTKKTYASGNPGFFTASIDRESSIQQAMIQAINTAENYVYIETQYFTDQKIADALVKRIQEKHAKNEPFHVYTVLPFSPNGDPGGKVFVEPVRELQWKLMTHCMASVEARTGKPWNTYLSFMFFAQWEGVSPELARLHEDGQPHTRTELLNESYRQPVYIHSKLMVIDDQTIINGSANLNERSLSGGGDTEIAVVQSPKPGHEAACRAIVSEFMREKILAPYFGENTIHVLDGTMQDDNSAAAEIDDGEWVKIDEAPLMVFSKKTKIREGKSSEIILYDNIQFQYDLEKQGSDKQASLVTTPSELYGNFLHLHQTVSNDKKANAYVEKLHGTNKSIVEKLLLLIEYVRKNTNSTVSTVFNITCYQLYKIQLYEDAEKPLDQRAFKGNQVKELENLAAYFNLRKEALIRSDTVFKKLPTIKSVVSPQLHLGSPEVVRHIQRVATSNYSSFASNEPGHTATVENGKVVAFPLKMGVCGCVGELQKGCEVIPDAPIGKDGKPNAIWNWLPEKLQSLVLRAAETLGYKGLR